MIDRLFEFDEKELPPAVVLATATLIAMFALGLVYRVIAFLVF